MKCPFCGFENDKVVDSRESKEADSIRRRREYLKCEKRFTTYERIDEIPYMVVKKDGRRERFDRQKSEWPDARLRKRPVPISRLEQIVNEAESFCHRVGRARAQNQRTGRADHERLRRDKKLLMSALLVYLDSGRAGIRGRVEGSAETKERAVPKGKTAVKS
jgi:transcriptional repressor NrdR